MLSLVGSSLSLNVGAQASVVASRGAALTMAVPNAAPVYDGKYAEELRATAAAMVATGKGLLACDESTGTIGTRLEARRHPTIHRRRPPHPTAAIPLLLFVCVRGGGTLTKWLRVAG